LAEEVRFLPLKSENVGRMCIGKRPIAAGSDISRVRRIWRRERHAEEEML